MFARLEPLRHQALVTVISHNHSLTHTLYQDQKNMAVHHLDKQTIDNSTEALHVAEVR